MEILIAFILILAYILIATEYMTNVNKAAVAIFAAATGWVLYVCYGTDFVSSQHGAEFAVFKANNQILTIRLNISFRQKTFSCLMWEGQRRYLCSCSLQ